MAGEPTLQRGSTGEWLEYLQSLLAHHGMSITAWEAEFGDETDQAVRQFQQQQSLHEDGVVGPTTWDRLTGEQPSAQPSMLTLHIEDVLADYHVLYTVENLGHGISHTGEAEVHWQTLRHTDQGGTDEVSSSSVILEGDLHPGDHQQAYLQLSHPLDDGHYSVKLTLHAGGQREEAERLFDVVSGECRLSDG